MQDLLSEIRQCRICENSLPHEPNPILSGSSNSKLLIIGQAPGKKVHETSVPWDDPSGRLLRKWLGISDSNFYNPDFVALVPMGFCYPGKGKTGDLPPRKECEQAWHSQVMGRLKNVELTILIGHYAQKHYLKDKFKTNLTETVRSFEECLPSVFPLPHPSPRNRFWITKNPWFEKDLIPILRRKIDQLL